MHFRTVARALAIGALPGAVAIPGWQTPGPPGTRAVSVSAAPDRDGRAYAAVTILESATSALYRTDDGGATWIGLTEAGSGDAFSDVFADPHTAARVFAGAQRATGHSEVYRSDDLGAHWSTLLTLPNRCVPSFAAGTASDALFVSCGLRFLRTADAGLSWDEPPNPFTQSVRLAAGPGGVLYAYSVSQVFRSDDGGANWTPSGAAPAACPGLLSLSADPGSPGVLLAGAGVIGGRGFQCGGVYRSTDGGSSWNAASLSGVYVTDVAHDRDQPSRVYASASHIAGILPPGGIFVSGDGGRSFSNARLPATGALELAVSATGRFIYAATALGVYPREVRRTRVVAER
jgi:hypothetical protein